MYQPPAFLVDDPTTILGSLRRAGFGHLVTVGDDAVPEASALPFLVDDEVTTVRAHLARANRHWRSIDGAGALLIVPGVDAYVSPRWYPSKATDPKVVPTWNYELVHLRGTVRVVDDGQGKLDIVRTLTDHHEALTGAGPGPAGGGPAWAVSDAPDDFVERQLRAIVGIELSVESVEANWKLSQNRPEADRVGVRDALTAGPEARSRETGALMADERPPLSGGS